MTNINKGNKKMNSSDCTVKKLNRISKTLGLLCLTTALYADNFEWTVAPSDTSYQFLTFLFGTVSSDLTCSYGSSLGCSSLVPMLFSILNQGVLGISVIVLSYFMFTSTATTAHEGEFLGKSNSSLWVPARMVGGLSFLVPSSTGYSLLQAFIMKVALYGVAMANNIYGTVQSYVINNERSFAKEQGGTQLELSSTMIENFRSLGNNIFPFQCCYAYYSTQAAVLNAQITENNILADKPDGVQEFMGDPIATFSLPRFYGCNTFFSYYYLTQGQIDQLPSGVCNYNSTPEPLNAATDNTGGGSNICGYWEYKYSPNDKNTQQTKLTLQAFEANLYNQASVLVDKYIAGDQGLPQYSPTSTSTVDQSKLKDVQLGIENAIATAVRDMTPPVMTTVSNAGPRDWLLFPIYFYDWINKGSSSPPNNFGTPSYYKEGTTKTLDKQYTKFQSNIGSNGADFFNSTKINNALIPETSAFTLQELSPDNNNGPASKMYHYITNDFFKEGGDPLISLAKFGQDLLKLSFGVMLSSMIIGGTVMGLSAICSSISSSYAIGTGVAAVGFIVSFIMVFGIMMPLGVSLGIYLPLLPVTMYSLGALMWFMTVVESMIAGPVIALGLVMPSQDSMGKAQPSILMMFNLFLRPSLMVLGMVFGAKLFDIFAIYFTNVMINGFGAVSNMAGFNEWYGLIFVLFFFFYGYSIVAVAQRCYSMIYILPDRVISWIGGQAGGFSEVGQDLQVMQQGLTKGAEEAKKGMSSVTSGAMEASKGFAKAAKEKEEKAAKGKAKE
ncbi:hypothetical protein EBR43_00800 [bacterium]|nr:hypothetical protein [bacterium]NBW56327.1 hypothetical protein [bacterium]NBX71990.1 hypothetical protein [bacterium]